MWRSRRQFFGRALAGAGAMAGGARLAGAFGALQGGAQPAAPFLPVETPDVPKLAYTLDGGVKVFNLVAEPVRRELAPGRTADLWGYNGTSPGPTLEVVQGDRVRIVVENRLPEPTSMHWHGFEIPIAMDGMGGISQPLIPPGGRFVYEFELHQAGTFFYHSHMSMQPMLGLMGLFILHPRQPVAPAVDKDFGLVLQEFAILPDNTVPNTLAMEFNWLTMNGRSAPATTPLVVRLGDRVRIRLANMGMDHHPIHLHGYTFYVTGTEAGRVPQAAWTPANTVLVGVAQARDIEFVANNPGDWMLHCHMPHHMMNQMASMVGPMLETGHGMRAGAGMAEGMGMMQRGAPLSEENGPSLGRAIGLGADREKPATHMPMSPAASAAPEAAQNPWRVPGYPQDMMMPMDDAVAKPETWALAPGWSGGMMGMMTLVRVLPPNLYDEVMARVRAARAQA